ncbi:MAG: PD-(D/E)XK nuclease family protein [Gammaproteobacteria bacterium]|nr:PD-(D/E)XK nuclease family protein [Gammaproteobacteria bacterium]
MTQPSLFKTLSKYGSTEAENYLSESFVALINILLEQCPDAGLHLLNRICGLTGQVKFDNPDLIELSREVPVGDGRIDIEIRSGSEILAYIEVKHDAALANGQLEYYKEQLNKSDIDHKTLILLTRSLASRQETTLPENEYHHICWYDVHGELTSIKNKIDGEASIFLIDEFLTFLEEKHMSLERVGWEYIKGVPSMVALMDLLEVAILEAAPEVNLRKTGGWSWLGFRLDREIYCGIRYADSLVVVFENNQGIDPTYKHDLDLEKEHFFSLKRAEQLECFVMYIQNCFSGKPADES